MVLVSEQEIQMNLSRYLDMAANDDITITRNGEAIATLSRVSEDIRPSIDGHADWRSLVGILPADASFETAREERLSKI